MSPHGGSPTLVAAPDGRPFALTNQGTLGIVIKPCRGPAGWFGDVAQLGERCLRTAEVGGSNPLVSTKESMSRRSRNAGAPRLL
jgi:hypothetical protein